jgi:hypothetical protein
MILGRSTKSNLEELGLTMKVLQMDHLDLYYLEKECV